MGRAVEQAIDIRQQNHPTRASRLRHARGEPVIVAKADFFGGDAVIFIDDGNGPCTQKAIQRCRNVQITAAILQIIERYEHLRRSKRLGVQQIGPDARQHNLPNRCRGLRIGEAAAAAFFKTQTARAQCNRAGCDDNDPLPGLVPRADIRNERFQPLPPHTPVGLHQQRRSDLDHQQRARCRQEGSV